VADAPTKQDDGKSDGLRDTVRPQNHDKCMNLVNTEE